jgi:hypothetical protein
VRRNVTDLSMVSSTMYMTGCGASLCKAAFEAPQKKKLKEKQTEQVDQIKTERKAYLKKTERKAGWKKASRKK